MSSVQFSSIRETCPRIHSALAPWFHVCFRNRFSVRGQNKLAEKNPLGSHAHEELPQKNEKNRTAEKTVRNEITTRLKWQRILKKKKIGLNRRTDGRTDGRTDRRTGWRTDRRTGGQMYLRRNKCHSSACNSNSSCFHRLFPKGRTSTPQTGSLE